MAGFFSGLKNLFLGTPEKHKRVSTLMPQQQQLLDQLLGANRGPGAGGGFGDAADYYRDLLSNDSQTAQMMFAPEMRQFNEDIIPGLAEQFAGMGSGGLSSSGFRNAGVQAGTDLAERIAAIRAQLRGQGAAGLTGLGGMGLQNFSQDVVTRPGTEGLLAPALGALGTATFGPLGGSIGNMAGSFLQNKFGPSVGRNSNPYGNQASNAARASSFGMGGF